MAWLQVVAEMPAQGFASKDYMVTDGKDDGLSSGEKSNVRRGLSKQPVGFPLILLHDEFVLFL